MFWQDALLICMDAEARVEDMRARKNAPPPPATDAA
jgi:hypothetical protein